MKIQNSNVAPMMSPQQLDQILLVVVVTQKNTDVAQISLLPLMEPISLDAPVILMSMDVVPTGKELQEDLGR